MEFFARLEEILEYLNKRGCSVMICVDFNINILKKNNLTAANFDIINSNGFELQNSDPTRISTSMVFCRPVYNKKWMARFKLTNMNVYSVSLENVAKHSKLKPELSF